MMKLYVYVFNDNFDAVQECFNELGKLDTGEASERQFTGHEQFSLQITSLGTAPIQVLVRCSISLNKPDLQRDIDGIKSSDKTDLFLIDDHYNGVDPLAGQNIILPRLVKAVRRHATLLPISACSQNTTGETRSASNSFCLHQDRLNTNDTFVIGIPERTAKIAGNSADSGTPENSRPESERYDDRRRRRRSKLCQYGYREGLAAGNLRGRPPP